MDEETGLYYYGARYLDPRTSRWLSADPALGEYIPGAPVNEEAKKRNGNLPGMGGVFNVVNFQLYHYAGNNPVKYVDPDGRKVENKTDEIIAIKPESSDGYILLAPGAVYDGNAINQDGEMKYFDEGKIDGIIDKDGNIFKVSDTDILPWNISAKAEKDKNGNTKYSYTGALSWLMSVLGDLYKRIKGRTDDSGEYKMTDEGEPGKSWSGSFEDTLGSSDTWKDKLGDAEARFVPYPSKEEEQ